MSLNNLCPIFVVYPFFRIENISVFLKELHHRSCILKKLAKLFKIVIFNPFQSSPSLFLFALESPL